MVEDGEEQRGSETQRKSTGDTMETFSISINPQVLQTIDKEVEDGRSQAISQHITSASDGKWISRRTSWRCSS